MIKDLNAQWSKHLEKRTKYFFELTFAFGTKVLKRFNL